jgi:hypothetical protein
LPETLQHWVLVEGLHADFFPGFASVPLCVQAESMVYQTEKQLKEFEEKLPADLKVRQEY